MNVGDDNGNYRVGINDNSLTFLGNGDDTFFGGRYKDVIIGGTEKDAIAGGQGNDIIHGGDDDDDVIRGGEKRDWIYGEEGDDSLNGGTGDDLLYGGAGNDTYYINADHGNDTIHDFEGFGMLVLGDELGADDYSLHIDINNGISLVNTETGETIAIDISDICIGHISAAMESRQKLPFRNRIFLQIHIADSHLYDGPKRYLNNRLQSQRAADFLYRFQVIL